MKVITIAILSISAVFLGVVLVTTMGPEGADANSLLPPPSRTGAPGDAGTCSTCHSGNTAGRTGALTVFPESGITEYTPGQEDTIGVVIFDQNQGRWGFELTALKNSDNSAAGTLVGMPLLTSSQSSGGKTYISQTSNGVAIPFQPTDGTYWGRPAGVWYVVWTAPPQGTGPVTLYAAGVAADSSQSAGTGDFTYTTTLPLTEKSGTPVLNTTWGKLKQRYH